MGRPQDLFGAAPKTVLNKPFFHAQERLANGANMPNAVSGNLTRKLTDVIYNDIQGASLASFQVTLPPGTYYFEGFISGPGDISYAFRARIYSVTDASYQLEGVNGMRLGNIGVSGIITITSTKVFEFRNYNNASVTANPMGSNTASGTQEVYADLKIWQLDRSLEIAPKAVNGPLTSIPNVQPASPISGLDITTSGQVITVTPGACKDSTEEIEMAITTNKTWTVPSTNNLETYLFLVRLVADGSFDVKGYSTLAGPSSDNTVDAWRFISWARNNGSGVLMPYKQVGDRVDFPSGDLVVGTATASDVRHDISTIAPISCIKDATVTSGAWVAASGFNEGFAYDNNGVKGLLVNAGYRNSGQANCGSITFVGAYFWSTGFETVSLKLVSITLRR